MPVSLSSEASPLTENHSLGTSSADVSALIVATDGFACPRSTWLRKPAVFPDLRRKGVERIATRTSQPADPTPQGRPLDHGNLLIHLVHLKPIPAVLAIFDCTKEMLLKIDSHSKVSRGRS